MPKKKAETLFLPGLGAQNGAESQHGSPRGKTSISNSRNWRGTIDGNSSHRGFQKGRGDAAFADTTQSDLSTTLPSSSREEGRTVSRDFAYESRDGFSATRDSSAEDWQVQSPEEIIRDVKRYVHAMKPWRQELDDSILEKRRYQEKQDRLDRVFHILLPDNRVRAMEDELSTRVRGQILDDEEPKVEPVAAPPPQQRRLLEDIKAKGHKKVKNPWYMPAASWHKNTAAENTGDVRETFPYANVILGLGEEPKSKSVDEQADPRELTVHQKETLGIVEAYKQYMKGSRLPHFLQ
mmetsp:Transcript_22931/g.42491  ORF Transcript_22931/g.42491 Transcript_22931/m.42491 type:complete len:294 (+) Transcript_22931:76-957(+)